MKKKKVSGSCRLLALILTLLLLVSTATACFGNGETPSDSNSESGGQLDTGTETGEDTGTAVPGSSTLLTIADDGKSECKIYYETTLSQYTKVMNRIYNMIDLIERYTGVKLSLANDRFYDGNSDGGLAILIGITNYPATSQIVEKLKPKDYYMGVHEKKLLLCGTSEESVCNAIDYFTNKIVMVQGKAGKAVTVSPADNYMSHYHYGLHSIQCLETELKEYSIVMPQNATVNENLFAKNLRYYLYNEYGYDLSLRTDAEPETAYEILVGNTSRSTVEPDKNEYIVSASNGKLQLAADGMIGYDALLAYLKGTLLRSGNANNCVITEGTVTFDGTDGLTVPTSYATQKNGDARILFFNLYGGTEYNLLLRERMQIEMFLTYDADVLALQEMSVNTRQSAYKYPTLLKEAGFTEVSAKTTGNHTPIFYRDDRLREVDSGFRMFADEYNNGSSKSLTWAVFEVKDTGKQFIVISTHFCYFSDDNGGTEGRKAHARELLDEINKIRSQYPGLAIIAGGDLNCTPSSEPMDILREAGMKPTWEIAEEKNDQQSHHAYPTYDSNLGIFTSWAKGNGGYSASIDQAWVFGNMHVKIYAILTDYYALASSDHCPQLVDIVIE